MPPKWYLSKQSMNTNISNIGQVKVSDLKTLFEMMT